MATAAEVWRNFNTDGVPSSGKKKPSKADIRAWGTSLESSILQLAAQPQVAITPQMFGSPVNGSSDDTPGINAAFAYLQSIGGGTLRFPRTPGDVAYSIKSRMSCGRNVTISAHPMAIIRRKYLGTMLQNDLGITTEGGYSGNGNIVIEGGTWDGNGVNFYDAFNFFTIGHARGFTLRNIIALDGVRAHVVDFSGSCDGLIERNRFLGFASDRSTATDSLPDDRTFVEAVQCGSNRPGDIHFGTDDRTEVKNVTFRHNEVGANPNNSDPRFGSWGCAFGNHGGVYDRFNSGLYAYGNRINGCGYAGLRSYKTKDTFFFSNIITDCVQGIQVHQVPPGTEGSKDATGFQTNLPQAGAGLHIYDNDITGGQNGVYFSDGTDPVEAKAFHKSTFIHDNRFSGQSNDAIDLRLCDDFDVHDNSFSDLFRGVHTNFCINGKVSDNLGKNLTREFLWADNDAAIWASGSGYQVSTDIDVVGNKGKDIGYTGILVNGGVRINTVGNTLKNVSTFAATRFGISYTTSVAGGKIQGNIVEDAGATNKPTYGVNVSSTCSDIKAIGNDLFGSTAGMINLATGDSRSEFVGSGSPASAVSATAGSKYLDLSGIAEYIKTGSGTSGWALG